MSHAISSDPFAMSIGPSKPDVAPEASADAAPTNALNDAASTQPVAPAAAPVVASLPQTSRSVVRTNDPADAVVTDALDAPVAPAATAATSAVEHQGHHTSSAPLAIGLSVAGVIVALLVVAALIVRRRRRRDASSTVVAASTTFVTHGSADLSKMERGMRPKTRVIEATPESMSRNLGETGLPSPLCLAVPKRLSRTAPGGEPGDVRQRRASPQGLVMFSASSMKERRTSPQGLVMFGSPALPSANTVTLTAATPTTATAPPSFTARFPSVILTPDSPSELETMQIVTPLSTSRALRRRAVTCVAPAPADVEQGPLSAPIATSVADVRAELDKAFIGRPRIGRSFSQSKQRERSNTLPPSASPMPDLFKSLPLPPTDSQDDGVLILSSYDSTVESPYTDEDDADASMLFAQEFTRRFYAGMSVDFPAAVKAAASFDSILPGGPLTSSVALFEESNDIMTALDQAIARIEQADVEGEVKSQYSSCVYSATELAMDEV